MSLMSIKHLDAQKFVCICVFTDIFQLAQLKYPRPKTNLDRWVESKSRLRKDVARLIMAIGLSGVQFGL